MATEHFCTLFDLGYLPQGMVLRESLERHVRDFTLWILCMDAEVEAALRRLDLPSVRIIPLAEIETPELLAVKEGRSRGEYCWTMSPFLPRFVLDRDPGIQRVTYLDADVLVLNGFRPIFEDLERSGKHVLYTEHGFAAEYDQSYQSGRFCVQLLTYRNTPEARRVLDWWGDRCLEWCFARSEGGKYGDQRYLDHWERLFPDETHILQRPELTLAPWNAVRFPIGSAVIYHFHGLRLYENGRIHLWEWYRIPLFTFISAYCQYAQYLRDMVARMGEAGVAGRFRKAPRPTWESIKLRMQGRYRDGHWDRMARKFDSFRG
jgi:hypothetical protein